jgi:predicted DCC family thiol-disulfide oxidoreductase YuxK
METLDNKVIIYDDACPMCQAYTAAFVKSGWLKHRSGFSAAGPEMQAAIDLDRARHEIPLFDTKTGEVHYGLDALFLIIGERWPVFRPLFRTRWFRRLLYPLYQIITYNRRIIAGTGAPKTGFDCAPDVNLFYRGLYIVLAVGGALWLSYRPLAGFGWVFPATQLLFFAGILLTPKRLDFVGHWATVFLASSLVYSLIPAGMVWKTSFALLLAFYMWWKRRDNLG